MKNVRWIVMSPDNYLLTIYRHLCPFFIAVFPQAISFGSNSATAWNGKIINTNIPIAVSFKWQTK